MDALQKLPRKGYLVQFQRTGRDADQANGAQTKLTDHLVYGVSTFRLLPPGIGPFLTVLLGVRHTDTGAINDFKILSCIKINNLAALFHPLTHRLKHPF